MESWDEAEDLEALLLDTLDRYLARRQLNGQAVELVVRFRGWRSGRPGRELVLPLAGGAVPAPVPPNPFADDFRSGNVRGVAYNFTAPQGAIVRCLWQNLCRGAPEVGAHHLLAISGADSDRLSDVFKDSPAWKRVIVQGSTRGAYRLDV